MGAAQTTNVTRLVTAILLRAVARRNGASQPVEKIGILLLTDKTVYVTVILLTL